VKCGQLVKISCFFYREAWNILDLCVETFKYYSWPFSFHFEFLSRRGFSICFISLLNVPGYSCILSYAGIYLHRHWGDLIAAFQYLKGGPQASWRGTVGEGM